MANVFSWIKRAATGALDPNREARVQATAAALDAELVREREQFDLGRALHGTSLFREDLADAIDECYRRFAARALADGALSERERRALAWVGEKLGIDEARARPLRLQARVRLLVAHYSAVLATPAIDRERFEAFERLAAAFRLPPSAFEEPATRDRVRAALRDAFDRHRELLTTDTDAWQRLLVAARAVGIEGGEAIVILARAATRLLHELIANAKADGDVSDAEQRRIRLWMDRIHVDAPQRASVEATIARVNTLRDVLRGRLPSLTIDHLGLRGGEIVHAHVGSRFLKARQRQGQTVFEPFEGTLTITDARLLFVAAGQTVEAPHRRVQSIERIGHGFAVCTSGRGGGRYEVADPEMTLAIYQSAVRRSNQTLVSSYDPVAARHIPRDVRQRVFQRYGGRCADCGASDYLEFDHIVPVAKGGSNSDANVQLLCRKCNSKKSDRI